MSIDDRVSEDLRREVARLRQERDALAERLEESARANRRLSDIEALFQGVMAHTDDAIFVIDREGRYVWVNQAAAAVIGLTPEAVVGKTTGDLVSKELAAQIAKQDRQVLDSGESITIQETWHLPDGARTYLTSKHPYRSATGECLGVSSIARDITRGTDLEEALRASESRLREIIESSTNMFYIHTADHVLTYVSPHTQDFFECEPEEALVSWTEFVTDHPVNEAGYAITQRAIDTGERQPPYELELIGKKKRKIWVEVREAPLVREGKTVAITGSLTDITERKRMEQALMAQNERLRELDRLKNSFVGSVSHELRTPLTSIRGYAEFLQDEIAGPLSEGQAQYVAAVLEAAERLGHIVDDLLDFARLESGALTLFPRESSLTQKVQESINSLIPQANAAHLRLAADLPDAPVLLFADIDRLGQVLLNLINNAIKFTPPGGTVEVTLREADDEIRLEVRDTGVGIPLDKQTQIFEKFFQVDPSTTRAKGGAGLGLSISRALVEAHRGSLELESLPGQGATFRIRLRRSALEALARHEALEDVEGATAGD